MKQRRIKMKKAWRKFQPVLQKFTVTQSICDSKFDFFPLDVFTVAGVFRKPKYGL